MPIDIVLQNLQTKNGVGTDLRPSYQVNQLFSTVKEKWSYQDKSDIGSGTAASDDLTVVLDRASGKVVWKHKASNGLITNLRLLDHNEIVVTTNDGKVSLLKF